MSVPILTFFNNKGGVGKTSLVYHLSWMLAESGLCILACDLDPQANLTAAFLDEEKLEQLWDTSDSNSPTTIFRCIEPLTAVGDLREPDLQRISPSLALLPGDLALSGFEDLLSSEWPNCFGSSNLYRAFRVLSAFWQVAQLGAANINADVVLVDVGPNLGAINRSALIASDVFVVPLGADLFSLQGLRNLGPTLTRWRTDWKKRLDNWQTPAFALPAGTMKPIGYVVQQHGVRLSRPVKAYDRWVNRIPAQYRRSILDEPESPPDLRPADDPNCLATLKHYRSLVPMGQESRKPIFSLTVADGAIGSHAVAVRDAYGDFRALAAKLLDRVPVASVLRTGSREVSDDRSPQKAHRGGVAAGGDQQRLCARKLHLPRQPICDPQMAGNGPWRRARAVIFAPMVDDPSAYPDLFPTEKAQGKERQRRIKII